MALDNANIVRAARSYLAAGLCVLPARLKGKRVALESWTQYQKRLPTKDEIHRWFAGGADALCIVAGAVSGNLEMIDFDVAGELYPPWAELVEERCPGLLERLVRERSQGGGRHLCYRTKGVAARSTKLAQREVECPDEKPVTIAGKQYVPRLKDGRWVALVTLIETRGEGSVFLCTPSPGYVLEQGSFQGLPVLTADERATVIDCARALTEVPEESKAPKLHRSGSPEDGRPGDDYNQRGDIRPLLAAHGWTLVRRGENEYWRRPGKDHGWSATLRGDVFYCFSTNASPFEDEQAYSRFSVYALLEHEGDFAKAASALRRRGYGGADQCQEVNLSVMLGPSVDNQRPEHPDPGQIPERLLRVPGFIEQVVDYTLRTAPYPNPVLAFCGALALQAFLAGRRVRDATNNRTNIYLLALANSGLGKDHPRKVNQMILTEANLQDCLGDAFASGEGIEDVLYTQPCMLFQTDEIDAVIQAIKDGEEQRFKSIMQMLLKMYTSSNGIYPMRAKAGKEHRTIDQPSLCIFGTAIPKHYYEAFSMKMLSNGFFARMLIVEAGKRSQGQFPPPQALPEAIKGAARWWRDFRPGGGNMENWHPRPATVEYSSEAGEALTSFLRKTEDEYAEAEDRDDVAGMTIWARAVQKAQQLALIYACSENHQQLRITEQAIQWGWEFISYLTRRMLFMVNTHLAESDFERDCNRFLEKLRNAPGGRLGRSKLLKRMKMSAKEFDGLVDTLRERGDIEAKRGQSSKPGPTPVTYELTE